jgi:hypothetical protein
MKFQAMRRVHQAQQICWLNAVNNFYKQLRSGNTSPGKNHQTIAAGSIGRAALTNAIDIAAVACVGRGLAAAGEVLRARHSRSAHKA